jgi:hypothetical protein
MVRGALKLLGVVATGGGLSRQATYPLWKGFWLNGFLGFEPRSVVIALADGLCYLRRKSLQLKASVIGEGGPCPFWIIPWHLPYNWGKARKTSVREPSSCRLLVALTWLTFNGQPRLPWLRFSVLCLRVFWLCPRTFEQSSQTPSLSLSLNVTNFGNPGKSGGATDKRKTVSPIAERLTRRYLFASL